MMEIDVTVVKVLENATTPKSSPEISTNPCNLRPVWAELGQPQSTDRTHGHFNAVCPPPQPRAQPQADITPWPPLIIPSCHPASPLVTETDNGSQQQAACSSIAGPCSLLPIRKESCMLAAMPQPSRANVFANVSASIIHRRGHNRSRRRSPRGVLGGRSWYWFLVLFIHCLYRASTRK
jgi:hypothetical protein